MIPLPRLMLVTDRLRQGDGPLEDAVAAALSAGPALVQFREKDLSDDALENLVHRLREKTAKDPLIDLCARG